MSVGLPPSWAQWAQWAQWAPGPPGYQLPCDFEHLPVTQLSGATAWLPKSETDVDLTHQLERQRMIVGILVLSFFSCFFPRFSYFFWNECWMPGSRIEAYTDLSAPEASVQ